MFYFEQTTQCLEEKSSQHSIQFQLTWQSNNKQGSKIKGEITSTAQEDNAVEKLTLIAHS